MKKLRKYIYNVGMGFTQLLNALTGGDPDHSTSGRIGRKKINYGGVIPWSRPVIKVLEKALDIIDDNHCIDAIEEDEGKDAVGRIE